MRNAVLGVVVAAVLTGCSSTQPARPLANFAPMKLTPVQVDRLKTYVAKGLKDPDSAKFGEAFLATDDGTTIHVCGYVNAKNSFGGYVGEQPFYAIGERTTNTFSLLSVGGRMFRNSDVGRDVTLQMCSEAGIRLV